jgi:branched-chain amino acid transport system ATP-binding protein
MAMLEVEGIHTYYGHIHALHDVSVNVEEGEIVTIIGANGAGKSTMLKTTSGLLKPRKGSIRLNDEDLTKLRPHNIVEKGVVQVPEGRRIFGTLTVMENLDMGAFISKDTQKNLMTNPKVLLLDEPSMGLAPVLVDDIFATIRQLHAAGTTILLVEQNARLALQVASRGYVLQSGSIVLSDTSENLEQNEMVREAYLGE